MRFVVSMAVVLLLVPSIPAFQATAQESVLRNLLPTAGEIGPQFLVIDNRARSLEEQATGFANVEEATGLLAGWQWQENAFQRFESDTVTGAGAPVEKVDISLTRFASAGDAAAAMPYFLEDREITLGQGEFSNPSPIGDESRGINGFYNGYYDVTIYTRSGPLLLRVSAASASGSPSASPERIAREIVSRGMGLWQQAPASETAVPNSVMGYLPESMSVADTSCAWSDDESDLEMAAFLEQYDGVADAGTTLGEMGWQEGAYRQFGCDNPAPGHVGWLTMGVSRFADAQAAAEAVAFFAESRAAVTGLQMAPVSVPGDRAAALAGPTVNGTEYTLYLSDGPLLFRVTGVAAAGEARPDVERLATDLAARALVSQGNDPPAPTPHTIAAPTATPVLMPTLAPTAVPTPEPAPAIAPLPTSTPLPTLAPPTAVPTTIPVTIPTAAPPTATAVPPTATAIPTEPAALPTAPAGSPPTPTPRVIRPPTPTGG